MPHNIYLPNLARVIYIKDEVPGERAIRTFHLEPLDGGWFDHECGQCAMLSVFGRGEALISIAS
ncbi:MAG: 2-polyprenylphenol 6-hydroxylase [Gallionellaceae bacterium]|nr:MAG: 2-polyprenylphenol 6-hydroxylase [Gallionellaceae bacterium]